MSQPKTRTSVEIYGDKYIIIGNEHAAHIRKVANIVDEKMRDIHEMNPYLDTKRLAVLMAVNLVNEHVKLQQKYDDLLEKFEMEKGKTDHA